MMLVLHGENKLAPHNNMSNNRNDFLHGINFIQEYSTHSMETRNWHDVSWRQVTYHDVHVNLSFIT